MISKVITGNNFHGCCRYVCSDTTRMDIIEVRGVRDFDYKLMADDFEQNRKQHESKKKSVFHGILSFPKHEKPDKQLLIEISQKYLNRLGFENSQYIIAVHKDKKHCHLHLISSFVDINGNIVSENWIGLRAKKISQKLTDEYGLTPASSKNIKQINLNALSEKEYMRYHIYNNINEVLPKCNNFNDLETELRNRNILTQLKTKKGSNDIIQGVSFKSAEYTYKGSEVDRKFSYSNLNKQLMINSLKNTITAESKHNPEKQKFKNSDNINQELNM